MGAPWDGKVRFQTESKELMVQAPQGLGAGAQVDGSTAGGPGAGRGGRMCADADVFQGGGGKRLSGVKQGDAATGGLEVFSKQIRSRC